MSEEEYSSSQCLKRLWLSRGFGWPGEMLGARRDVSLVTLPPGESLHCWDGESGTDLFLLIAVIFGLKTGGGVGLLGRNLKLDCLGMLARYNLKFVFVSSLGGKTDMGLFTGLFNDFFL